MSHVLKAGRGAWIQVARGSIAVDGKWLVAGDGAALEADGKDRTIDITSSEGGEFLLFDLA